MNTFCSVRIEAEDSALSETVVEEVFMELKRLERLFSRYDCESQIYLLNKNAASEKVKVDFEVLQLISRSLELSYLSGGAFDITLGTVIDLWRQCESRDKLPQKEEIKQSRAQSGYQNVLLDFKEQSVSFARQGLQFDLGAVAKGYALDNVAAMLNARGIRKAQVNFGGNIYVIDSQPQAIGIRNPFIPEEIIETVSLADTSVSTSANYERFFYIANKKFSHLLDPLTASPVENDILSVSVISKNATLADALSSALFVMGLPKAEKILRIFSGIEAIIICKGTFGRQPKVHKLKGGM